MSLSTYTKACFDYNAAKSWVMNGTSDISIRKEDILLVIDPPEGGWIRVKKEDGEIGYVPENYVKKVENGGVGGLKSTSMPNMPTKQLGGTPPIRPERTFGPVATAIPMSPSQRRPAVPVVQQGRPVLTETTRSEQTTDVQPVTESLVRPSNILNIPVAAQTASKPPVPEPFTKRKAALTSPAPVAKNVKNIPEPRLNTYGPPSVKTRTLMQSDTAALQNELATKLQTIVKQDTKNMSPVVRPKLSINPTPPRKLSDDGREFSGESLVKPSPPPRKISGATSESEEERSYTKPLPTPAKRNPETAPNETFKTPVRPYRPSNDEENNNPSESQTRDGRASSSSESSYSSASSYDADTEHLEDIITTTYKGNTVIKGAKLEKLTEKLYDRGVGSDFITEYVDTFLMTFRSFADPKTIFSLIVQAYFEQITDEEKLKARRLRICNFLKRWLENHYYDWEQDEGLQQIQGQFITSLVATGTDDIIVNVLRKAQTKARARTATAKIVVVDTAPKPIIPPSSNIYDIDASEFVKQICLYDYAMFSAIPIQEFLVKSWQKAELQKSSPTLWKVIDKFNQFSTWVCYWVVNESNLKKRASLVIKFIRIAKECLTLNNFNTVFAIIAGLGMNPVYRLKKTWDLVKKEKEFKIYEELQPLISKVGNYAQYRELLHTADPPCIPYLGVYQTDITFIHDGNPDYLDENKTIINFFKRRLLAEVIREIQTYKLKGYTFAPVESIQNWIKYADIPIMDEETLYTMSLVSEPKEGAPTAVTKEKRGGSASQVGSKHVTVVEQGRARPASFSGGLPTGGNKQTNKLNKFFGESNIDFNFYSKYTNEKNDTPKSLLDDIDLAPVNVKPLKSDMTPEQVEEYKQRMQRRYDENEEEEEYYREEETAKQEEEDLSPTLADVDKGLEELNAFTF